MSERVDSASRLIFAPASTVYEAFSAPAAMEAWLPPRGMTGTMLAFDFREGGFYRMRLTYKDPNHPRGKTSEDADEVGVRIVKLIPNRLVEQAVRFESEHPEFSGEMRITWTFETAQGGTLVGVRCEDVPPGIRREDHEAGLKSTLGNLAAFAEKSLS